MKHQNLVIGSILAVGIIATLICVGMVTGYSVFKPFISVKPVSNVNTSVQSSAMESTPVDTPPYIAIDPIANKTTGDLLIVTGSTNLPADASLMIQVGGTGGNTEVNAGTNGVHRYSMPIDTSILKPGTLNITVTQMIGDPAKGTYRPGTVKATASFTLNGTSLASATPVQPTITASNYIHLNAIGNRSVGDQFLITGTTSLPIGTNLLWQIMPDTGTPPTGVNMTASGDGGNNMVTKGDGTANRVSFAADMSRQVPGKWVVLVGVAKEGQFEMEKPLGIAYFTLQ